MSAFEVEVTILNVTVIAGLLIKAAKWTLEELEGLVVQYRRLTGTIAGTVTDQRGTTAPDAITPTNVSSKKLSQQLPPVTETRSKDESHVAA